MTQASPIVDARNLATAEAAEAGSRATTLASRARPTTVATVPTECLFCQLAGRCVQGIRVSTPRESTTWARWRADVQRAVLGRQARSPSLVAASPVPTERRVRAVA